MIAHLRRGVVAVVMVVALAACSGPSVVELESRLDEFPVPETWELADSERFNAEDCSKLLDPACPRVRRWYRTVADTRVVVIEQAVAAIAESNFAIEREPIACPDGSERRCAFSATHGGLRLWVFPGNQRRGAPKPADGEVIVELQLAPTT